VTDNPTLNELVGKRRRMASLQERQDRFARVANSRPSLWHGEVHLASDLRETKQWVAQVVLAADAPAIA
jgi:hypothetical protein